MRDCLFLNGVHVLIAAQCIEIEYAFFRAPTPTVVSPESCVPDDSKIILAFAVLRFTRLYSASSNPPCTVGGRDSYDIAGTCTSASRFGKNNTDTSPSFPCKMYIRFTFAQCRRDNRFFSRARRVCRTCRSRKTRGPSSEWKCSISKHS